MKSDPRIIPGNGDGLLLQAEFEALFRAFDPLVQFRYLKSFGRARVDVTSAETAARARHHLHGTPFGDTAINCFFGRPPVFRCVAFLFSSATNSEEPFRCGFGLPLSATGLFFFLPQRFSVRVECETDRCDWILRFSSIN